MIITKRMKFGGKNDKAQIVVLEFDDTVLAYELGHKAFYSRGKKSILKGGTIKCTVRPVEEGDQ